jgi:RluA family pseudouridine synthase
MTSHGESDDLKSCLHPGVREIFRDDCLWVLDKPAGVLSHPNPPAGSAPNALLRGSYDFRSESYELSAPGAAEGRVFLAHRLDQETSGLILCALDEETAARLQMALAEREVLKEYRALVLGRPSPPRGEWADLLEKTSQGGRVTVKASRGRPNAVTRYAALKTFEPSGLSLLALWPQTGRTHQLRVQCALRGLPIAGDERYGDFRANRFLASEIGLKRMFLHALRIELRHPRTGHVLKLQAPLRTRLSAPLEKLKDLLEPVPRRDARRGR